MEAAAVQPARPAPKGPMRFFGEAVRLLMRPALAVPAILLLVVLTGSNIVILQNIPPAGQMPGGPFAAAALVRIVGLLVLTVAILRIAADSPRRPFLPDGAFFLYALFLIASFAIGMMLEPLAGDRTTLTGSLATNLGATLLFAPLAAWGVALAVDRPIALNPLPWLRCFGRWLPHILIWSILVALPMAMLHAWIDLSLLRGEIAWFWTAALFDGLLSTAMVLFSIGLAVAAYRRVAQS